MRGCAFEWFRPYLSDRKQYLSVNGSNSNSLSITSVIPQGSVLGTLLFLIYISDLPIASKKLNFISLLIIQTSTVNPKIYLIYSKLLTKNLDQ